MRIGSGRGGGGQQPGSEGLEGLWEAGEKSAGSGIFKISQHCIVMCNRKGTKRK